MLDIGTGIHRHDKLGIVEFLPNPRRPRLAGGDAPVSNEGASRPPPNGFDNSDWRLGYFGSGSARMLFDASTPPRDPINRPRHRTEKSRPPPLSRVSPLAGPPWVAPRRVRGGFGDLLVQTIWLGSSASCPPRSAERPPPAVWLRSAAKNPSDRPVLWVRSMSFCFGARFPRRLMTEAHAEHRLRQGHLSTLRVL